MASNQDIEKTLLKPWQGGIVTAVGAGVLAFILHEPSQAPLLIGEGFVGGTALMAAMNSVLRRKGQN